MTLLNHCGTKRVDESVVRAVPAPEWTDTWHPVTHGQIIESLEISCHNNELDVVDRAYSLSADGARMFGVWTLDRGQRDMAYALGMRNSTDKSMLYGLTSGTSVFVCDNLCFSGDFLKFRMHTKGLDEDELLRLGDEAVGDAIINMRRLASWQDGLHELWVPDNDRKALVYDMATQGVFAPGQINNYLGCLDEEMEIRRGKPLDNGHSLYNMHGAATRLMRGWSLLRVADATKALNQIVGDYEEQRLWRDDHEND